MYIPCKNCGRHFETWTTLAKDSSFCTPFCEEQMMLFPPNKSRCFAEQPRKQPASVTATPTGTRVIAGAGAR